jgi:ATP-binding cassette subfamily F protein 1
VNAKERKKETGRLAGEEERKRRMNRIGKK